MGVFYLFLLATSLGILTTLFWIREDDVGRGYFQMNSLVVLGLLGLAVAVETLHPFEPYAASPLVGKASLWGALGATFLYYFAVWRERWDIVRIPAAVATLACTVALVLAAPGLISTPVPPLPHRLLLLEASVLTSALLLGWSLIAMLLGHWYLVSPKLPFRYLITFCQVLVGTVVLRFLALGGTLLAAASVDELIEPHPWRLLTGFAAQGMFFWFRVLWGLLIPAALAWMSLHCAKRRSNQSATGILYVLVVGTFIGEITAYYLTITTGVPI